ERHCRRPHSGVGAGTMLLALETPLGIRLESFPGIRREARRGADLTEDDVRRALVAALDADRVLDPLQAGHPRTLDGGLDVVPRQHGGGGGRTVQIESPSFQGRLDGAALPSAEHLLLAGARRRDSRRGAEHEERPRLRHLWRPPWASTV